ncbi:MAG: hypothetical protein B7Y02_01450 [Rhodobacterales bacterium 17-64-5]|nr:MAG: hypothetical protein B7Y02_01450 [Rhodobacterales bacterium 17-64-5]
MTKTKGGADALPNDPQAEKPATSSVSGPPVTVPVKEQPVTGGAFVRQADGTLKPEEQEG